MQWLPVDSVVFIPESVTISYSCELVFNNGFEKFARAIRSCLQQTSHPDVYVTEVVVVQIPKSFKYLKRNSKEELFP